MPESDVRDVSLELLVERFVGAGLLVPEEEAEGTGWYRKGKAEMSAMKMTDPNSPTARAKADEVKVETEGARGSVQLAESGQLTRAGAGSMASASASALFAYDPASPDHTILRLRLARDRVHFQGLPARICWLGYGERAEMGEAINDLVKRGDLKAPIAIGRDHLDTGSVASPKLAVSSNLDQAISQRLQAVIGEEVAKAERQVRAKVDSLVSDKVEPVKRQIAAVQAEANQRVQAERQRLDQVEQQLQAELKRLTAATFTGNCAKRSRKVP